MTTSSVMLPAVVEKSRSTASRWAAHGMPRSASRSSCKSAPGKSAPGRQPDRGQGRQSVGQPPDRRRPGRRGEDRLHRDAGLSGRSPCTECGAIEFFSPVRAYFALAAFPGAAHIGGAFQASSPKTSKGVGASRPLFLSRRWIAGACASPADARQQDYDRARHSSIASRARAARRGKASARLAAWALAAVPRSTRPLMPWKIAARRNRLKAR